MDYFYKGTAIKKNAPVSWIAKADSLAANTNLVCVEDVDNKKNSVLSATAFFSAFTSLTVAHGYQKNYGNWCVVDGTNITTYYGTSATQMSQVAHGLTISDFLTVIIKQKTTQNAEITIMTKGGQFTISTVPHWHGANGDVRMFGAQDMTGAELSYGLSDSRQDVWLFVDSYGTEGDVARVPRQIQNLGYDSFLACGHGGGNSAQTYPQFETLIALAQPKLCVWMIGMNDPDSSSAINATWKSYAEQFATACEARGIIPVFTTIPNVPNYRHTFKNEWVKASGYRYVDWAKAVGAESAGSSWYTDMLSSDNVHPAELGAKALAMRTVLDVPELANVSKIPTKTSDLTNDSGYQTAAQVQAAVAAIPAELPAVTASDNGKVLGVVSGAWAAKTDTAYQKPVGGIPATDLAQAVQTSLGKADSAYQKPSGGIPASDLASAVQTSLGKADTALQSGALQTELDDNVGPARFVLARNGNTITTVESFASIATSLELTARRVMFVVVLAQSGGNPTSVFELYPTLIDMNNRLLTIVGYYDGDRYTAELTAASVSSTMTGTLTVEPMAELPSVTATDNGKFLRVVNGAWAAQTVPSAESNSFGGGS